MLVKVERINWKEISPEVKCATVEENGDIFLHKYAPEMGDWGWQSLDMEYYGTISITLPPTFEWNKTIIERPE